MKQLTYIQFNTFDNDKNPKEYHFDLYLNYVRPVTTKGGVYILLNHFEHNEPEFLHLDYTGSFLELFKDEPNNMKLKRFKYNSMLIYECDINEMYDIHNWVGKSEIYLKFYKHT